MKAVGDHASKLKVLICKPSSLGDIIHALPVLRRLKACWPDSSVYWWVATGFAGLLKEDPQLDGIFLFDKKSLVRLRDLPKNISFVSRIRKMRFDYILDLQGLLRSAVFSWLCKGKRTIGVKDWREGAPLFYDVAVPRPGTDAHAVDWYLECLKAVIPEPLFTDAASRVSEWLPRNPTAAASASGITGYDLGTDRPRYVIFHPCTRWQSKHWPLDSFIQCAREVLARRKDIILWITGSKNESTIGQQIVDQTDPSRVKNYCGAFSLPEMIEAIRLCDVMLTNDTGPMHIAAALKKPLVALFGPTSPLRTGPYGMPDSVLTAQRPCMPCFKTRCPYGKTALCMQNIPVERVVAEILKRLS